MTEESTPQAYYRAVEYAPSFLGSGVIDYDLLTFEEAEKACQQRYEYEYQVADDNFEDDNQDGRFEDFDDYLMSYGEGWTSTRFVIQKYVDSQDVDPSDMNDRPRENYETVAEYVFGLETMERVK